MLLLCDVSKREVSTQPKLTVAPRLPAVGVLLLCDVSKREVSTHSLDVEGGEPRQNSNTIFLVSFKS